ncbi:hypothetical protein KCTC32516_01578 [Polaribacter huanghezhanensis]|uniref:hypothetical protein n=1 Tax=Polaribacter huanghezhanensis TaxID=1354726 RepID=UPI0026488900|nr:hypothetical protein [Polaribacter huanghezhanensis]WKD86217.1 hypothetical protein KCTC32516_01578 [Polaribacter huanghezhanensis]
MKPQILKTIALLLITFTLINCTKSDDQDQLPPITQTGANTFGAIVDGRAFVPKTSYSSTPGGSRKSLEVKVGENFIKNNGDDKWLIRATNAKNSPQTYIYIYIFLL